MIITVDSKKVSNSISHFRHSYLYYRDCYISAMANLDNDFNDNGETKETILQYWIDSILELRELSCILMNGDDVSMSTKRYVERQFSLDFVKGGK